MNGVYQSLSQTLTTGETAVTLFDYDGGTSAPVGGYTVGINGEIKNVWGEGK